MPLYEYRCAKCGKILEVIQGFSDAPLRKHEECGGRLDKLISRSGFVLKGSGWYQSDYKPAARSSSGEASGDSGGAADEAAKPSKSAEGGKEAAAKDPPAKDKPSRGKKRSAE